MGGTSLPRRPRTWRAGWTSPSSVQPSIRHTLVALDIPPATPIPDGVATSVVYVDTFGNCKLAGLRSDLEASVGPMRPGRAVHVEADGAAPRDMAWADTFGDVPVGTPILYVDSYDRLTIAVNQGSAAAALGLVQDQPIRILVA